MPRHHATSSCQNPDVIFLIIHLRKKLSRPDKEGRRPGVMDIPVLNRGSYLYTVKLTVTSSEALWLLQYRWHKLRGQPWNPKLGNIFDLVMAWRKTGEILYSDERLVPVEKGWKCVGYAQVDVDEYRDLMRFRWVLNNEGYAQFRNELLNCNITMHRYINDFPVGLVVDHVRWNRLDNRKHMLRVCTVPENNRNMSYNRTSLQTGGTHLDERG